MKEVWKLIDGYDSYEVSNLGRIKSLSRVVKHKNRNIKWPERILRSNPNSRGYVHMKLYNGKVFNNVSVHRLVAEAFLTKIPGKLFVNHINGIKSDNRAENLEWCTHSENVKHAYSTGLTSPSFGDSSHSSKLSSQDVIEIRTLYKQGGISQSQLATKYNVLVSNINMILTNKTWKREQFRIT